LVTLAISAVIFTVSYLYPHLMALGMIIYNLGLALIPAIFGALWNRPRTNVMLAMRWGCCLQLSSIRYGIKTLPRRVASLRDTGDVAI
jgi:cytochrome c biogenesis protein CcdA